MPARTANPAESQQDVQDRRIADATVGLAASTARLTEATFVLALFTALAVVVPVYQRWRDKANETNAAMHQMLVLFQQRTKRLAWKPSWTAQALLEGLDVVLARALADDIAKAMPRTTMTTFVYTALFAGFDAISDAVHWQRVGENPYGDNLNLDKIRNDAVGANVMLKRAQEPVITELKKRRAEPAPSEIGTMKIPGQSEADKPTSL